MTVVMLLTVNITGNNHSYVTDHQYYREWL